MRKVDLETFELTRLRITDREVLRVLVEPDSNPAERSQGGDCLLYTSDAADE